MLQNLSPSNMKNSKAIIRVDLKYIIGHYFDGQDLCKSLHSQPVINVKVNTIDNYTFEDVKWKSLPHSICLLNCPTTRWFLFV